MMLDELYGALRLFNAGWSLEAIARALNVTAADLAARMARMG